MQGHAVARGQLVQPQAAPPGGQHHLGEAVGVARVHRARHGDTDADQAPVAARPLRQAALAQLGDERARPRRVVADGVAAVLHGQHPPAQVGQHDRDVGRAHVHAEDGSGRRPGTRARPAAPAVGRPDAHLGDEPGRQQRAHGLGDGRARQPGAAGDLGPRDPPLLPDQAELRVDERAAARPGRARHPAPRRPASSRFRDPSRLHPAPRAPVATTGGSRRCPRRPSSCRRR